MSKAECMRKCLRRKIVWFIGGGVIATLVGILIGLGVMFPGAGTVIAILVALGLAAFVTVTAIWDCWRKC